MRNWLGRRGARTRTQTRAQAGVLGALAMVLLLGISACSSSSTGGTSGSKPTITIWNDALASGSCGVPAAKSFLTKGVALFEKTNPASTSRSSRTECDGFPASRRC